jgi:AraC-like DNA-binding protein
LKEPAFNLLPALILFGAIQGLFFSLVLFRMRTGNRLANRLLASLLLFFTIGLVDGFLSVTYTFLRYPFLIGIYWPLQFAYGPLIYFYVKSLTVPQREPKRLRFFAHFLPVAIFAIYLIPFYLLDVDPKARNWYFSHSHLRNFFMGIHPIEVVGIIQLTGYLVLALRLLERHSKYIRQNFSSLENISLSWLRTVVVVGMLVVCLYAFLAGFSQFFGVYEKTAYLYHLFVAVVIYVMAYKGIRQPRIFADADAPRPAEENAHLPAESLMSEVSLPQMQPSEQEKDRVDKYKKSALTVDQSEKILARLTTLMEEEKPHLEMELTLPMLSKMLDVSPHHLSQVINENLEKNFFDFVNEYRVEEARKALVSPGSDRLSILGIAMDAGFNSKSAFYSAFNRHTGMTPSQYKKSNKNLAQSPAQPSLF